MSTGEHGRVRSVDRTRPTGGRVAPCPCILVIDEERISREGLVHILKARLPGTSVFSAASVETIWPECRPDVVLYDLKASLPTHWATSGNVVRLRHVLPASALVVMTANTAAEGEPLRAFLGIARIFDRALGIEDLLATVGDLLASPGRDLDPPDRAAPYALAASLAVAPSGEGKDRPFGAAHLTPRERDVLVEVRRGKPNKIIAHDLRMSISTVKVHIGNIMRKLHATNRVQIAFWQDAALPLPPDPADPAFRLAFRPGDPSPGGT